MEVKFQRLKTKGVPEKTSALITGDIEVKVLTDYESCFSGQQKTGRYFRKMKIGADGISINATKSVLGHNTTAKTGVRIATVLGLPNPELYTGHTFRRTCATICVERGMQLVGIKQITGHKSDTVAQKYIDRSKNMRQGGADTLSLKGLQKDEDGQELRKRKSPWDTVQSTRVPVVQNAGTNMSVNFYNCASVNYNAKNSEYEYL